MNSRNFYISFLGLLLLGSTRVQAEPVGMVCYVAGKVELKLDLKSTTWKPLGLLQRVSSGNVVRSAAGGQAIIVMFGNGKRFKITAGKQAVVQATSVQGAQIMASLAGPSARVAMALGASRVGALVARPAPSYQRLMRQSPGWLPDGARHFGWEQIPEAAAYTFTLIDQNDNILWSERVTNSSADYPAELPELKARRPYIWHMMVFGQSGKPLRPARWGIIAFLDNADAQQLTTEAQTLQEEARQQPDDATPVVMLAELYRQYGVLEKTLETLETLKGKQPGVDQAIDETYAEAGRFALFLAGREVPPRNLLDMPVNQQ